ncbi:MAG: YlmH/Sll1252 family protein [Acidaminococcaceae bacterium]|nr:YlmH/Sll1252 family protein [Acidaminococcaceae bacterium]
MVDREKILRYFRSSEDETLSARLLDLADGANKVRKYRISDFLDPHGLHVAEIVAANYENIRIETDGGFANAERQRAAFVAEDFKGGIDYEIACLLIKWDKRYYDLTHRDILGALMGSGCKREALGDIVFIPDGAQIVTDKNLVNFFLSEFKTAGRVTVTVEEITVADLYHREEKVKEISATVADLRLDAVAAAGYGVSRSYMADEIKGQNVKLNWQVAKKASQSVEQGDVISFRGRGRVELAEVRGTTKKGRVGVTLKRYI